MGSPEATSQTCPLVWPMTAVCAFAIVAANDATTTAVIQKISLFIFLLFVDAFSFFDGAKVA